MHRPPFSHICCSVLFACSLSFGVKAQEPQNIEFSQWQVTGNVSEDSSTLRQNGGSPVRLEPGTKATLSFDKEASGEVIFWTYDDGTISQSGKKRHTGPQWGLVDDSGNELLLAIRYAPYLHAEGSYVITEKNKPSKILYVGPRVPNTWQKWTLRFDPENGGQLLMNDKPADNRWNWNESSFPAFSGLVLYGDTPGGEKAQEFLVEVAASTGEPMQVKPVIPKIVPDTDPAAEGNVPTFQKDLLNEHPRVLFTKKDLPRIKAFYESSAGQTWREMLDKYAAASSSPTAEMNSKFLHDATEGQRQGFWKIPTLALHYLLTGNQQSLQKTIEYLEYIEKLPHWEEKPELDSGMSSANMLIGTSLAFDWVYDELDPEFREKMRQKLWLQARAQYYGGHLNLNKSTAYWQADPQNNHRWHRNAGLTLAVLATYTGQAEQNWLLSKTVEELEFIAKWLPEDGTSHEGPGYLIFGGNHLVLAFDAADHCLDTKLLEIPFFKNVSYFRLLALTSGMNTSLPFGDDDLSSLGSYANFFLLIAEKNKQVDVGEMLRRVLKGKPKFMEFSWFSLIWDRENFAQGDETPFPTIGYFPDMGVAYLHDKWGDDGISAMFKCSPLGGYKLNEYRAKPDGSFRYVNVAHDDPDANSFIIANGSQRLAETDGYSKAKQSSSLNTVLINGTGQVPAGRQEGSGWTQPAANKDMTDMGKITGWLHDGVVTAIEGEAAGSYLAYSDKKTGASRPAIDRYRRSFFWVKDQYILILDDVRAPSAVDITWLLQGPTLKTAENGHFTLSGDGKSLPVQLLSDKKMDWKVETSTADNRGKNLGLQQLQATVSETNEARFISLYNSWNQPDLSVSFKENGANEMLVTVNSADFTDEWTWKTAGDGGSPSPISVKRVKGTSLEGFPMDFTKSTQPSVDGLAVIIP
ncbi:MAG: hypothetical protein ACK5LK_05230 [Chthoniobacterales bacterium]